MKYCFIWVKILYHYSSWLLIKQLWKEFERYKENVNALINPSSNEHWIYSHLWDSLYLYFDLFLHKQVNSLSYWESFSSNLDFPNMVGGSSDVTKYMKKCYALKTSGCVLKFITGQRHRFFSIWVFLHKRWQLTGQQWKGVDHLYSSLSLLPNHKHSDIYLQFYIWYVDVMLLIALHAITRLLLNEMYSSTGISA